MIVLDEKSVYTKNSAKTTVISHFRRVIFDDNFDLLVNNSDGFFNATSLCDMKNKRIFHFQESRIYKHLEPMLLQKIEFCDKVQYKARDLGFSDQSAVSGMYYHPILFLALASWCGEDFYVKVAIAVNSFFNQTAERRALFDRTFSLKPVDLPARDNDNCVDTPYPLLQGYRMIMYAGFELQLLDKNKYINASSFCYKYSNPQKSLKMFSKSAKFIQLIKHLKLILNLNPVYDQHNVNQRSPEYGTFYHPLLFLTLTSWVDSDFYIIASKIVFAYLLSDVGDITDIISNNVSATTVKRSDTTDVLSVNVIKSPAQKEPLSTNVTTESPYLAPTTPLSNELPVPNERESTFTWVDNSNTCSSVEFNNTHVNNVLVNVYTETEMEIERKSWQKRLENAERNHLTQLEEIQHELKKVLDQKQSETAVLLKRLNDVEKEKNEYFLRSTEHKKRVDELTENLAQLELSNEHLRITKLKRNVVDEKHNLIRDVYKSTFGKDRMEILIVTCSGNGSQYYGFRRKLKGALNAINSRTRLEHGDSVQLWFLSNNAKQDYIDCKSYLYDKANETGIKLKTHCNSITVGGTPSIDKFNTVELMQDFGKLIGMIELDAGFLQRVLELLQDCYVQTSSPTSSRHNQTDTVEALAHFISQQSDQMVRDIYQYVFDDYKQYKQLN
ncbi:uncharacterized protein LOC112602222 [Melanaphis sacchari]|uniref:uncharacterized protein LOC112602222 n=1 Tax=Melanaphis sacchari TaxID=742174 RepID=UPI000DC14F2E|nr:uncharacterized protein LOC112602222 [Melanaphis sacchari]